MKELSKKVSRLLMELDSVDSSDREQFDVICKLERTIATAKKSICYDKNGDSYFTLASNIMMKDIAEFLDTYREKNKTPAYKYYKIKLSYSDKFKNKTQHIIFESNVPRNVYIKYNGIKSKIQNLPLYNIFDVIGLEGEYSLGYSKYLLEEEYNKFLKIREENSSYFLPYIKDIIELMNTLECIERKK